MIKKQNKQILLNMATGWLPVITDLAVMFFLVPYQLDKLGVALVGVWALINRLTNYLILTQGSAGGAITKYVAEHNRRGDRNMLRCVISTGITEYLFLALIAALAGAVICFIADKIPGLHAPDVAFSRNRLALGIMVLALVVNLPFLGIRAAIAGFQRYDFLNLLTFITTIVRALATVVVLALGHQLIAIAICFFTVSLLGNLAAVCFLRTINPVALSLRHCKWSVMKTMFTFGFFSLVAALAATIFHRTDAIVIGAALVPASAAIYVYVYERGIYLLDNIRSIYRPIVTILMPVASEYAALPAQQRREKIQELFTRGSRFPVVLTLPLILFLIIFGREFLSLWLGPKFPYARESHIIFVILAVPHIFALSYQAGAHMLVGLARHRVPGYLFMAAAAMNLALSIVFVRYWGIFGVALGTAVPEIILNCIMHFYYKNVFDISMSRYYWKVWSRVIPLGLALAALMLFQKQYAAAFNLPQLLLIAAADGLLFWTVSYWVFDTYERQVLRQILKGVLRST